MKTNNKTIDNDFMEEIRIAVLNRAILDLFSGSKKIRKEAFSFLNDESNLFITNSATEYVVSTALKKAERSGLSYC